MIFYTLHGPSYKLEIHDDKIRLVKKGLLNLFRSPKDFHEYPLSELIHFEVTSPKFLFWGQLEFASGDGQKRTLRFSTNQQMMAKIEKYIQKIVAKNCDRKKVTSPSRRGRSPEAAA
jgi:hypothetical protein